MPLLNLLTQPIVLVDLFMITTTLMGGGGRGREGGQFPGSFREQKKNLST